MFFVFKQKTAYELRISDWSSDVCSSDLIFIATVDVGQPLTRSTGIIQIEHRCHGIDPQAIQVEHLQPIQRAGQQEGAHLVAGIVEYQRRSAERRVGKEGVSTCRSGWSPDH